MTDLVPAFAAAADPREMVQRLARFTRGRAPADVELWLGVGGWVRGRLTDIDGRGEAVVLVEPEGEVLYVRVEDVRACRVHAPDEVLDILSEGRFEPVEESARTVEGTQAVLRALGERLRDSFGIGLEVDLDEATTVGQRQALHSAARALVEVLEAMGEDREGAGALARRVEVVSIERGHRPNVRYARRRLVYVIDADEGPQGRLQAERLRRNVESVLA